MAIPVVEFSRGGTKLERFLSKNQHTQRKLLNFENWCSVKKCKNFTSKINFLCQKTTSSESLKNTNLEAHFLLLRFLDNINF